MSELTPAQKLRVAAALSGATHQVVLSRENALQLARDWQRADEALKALAASEKFKETRIRKMEDWVFRIIVSMGAMQTIAAWWLP